MQKGQRWKEQKGEDGALIDVLQHKVYRLSKIGSLAVVLLLPPVKIHGCPLWEFFAGALAFTSVQVVNISFQL